MKFTLRKNKVEAKIIDFLLYGGLVLGKNDAWRGIILKNETKRKLKPIE